MWISENEVNVPLKLINELSDFVVGWCVLISSVCVYSGKRVVWCFSGELAWRLGQSVQIKEKPFPSSWQQKNPVK